MIKEQVEIQGGSRALGECLVAGNRDRAWASQPGRAGSQSKAFEMHFPGDGEAL